MKKNLLMVAGLFAFTISGTLTTKVNANDFEVDAQIPGDVNFSGSGTAQFNNSLGTNNSFQVGSSTNLGVNANVSSTNGYSVGAVGDLKLDGQTQLQQVIGTSGASSQQANSQAHNTAMSQMESWSQSHGNHNSYGDFGYATLSDWQDAYDSAYNDRYTSASSSSQSSSSNSSDGSISGSFSTIETGSAQTSGDSSSWRTEAATAASTATGSSSWVAYGDSDVDANGYTQDEWQDAYDSSYNEAYAKASAASNRYSDSTVNVTGIGSDANVFAKDGSSFEVNVSVIDGGSQSSTDTASGSAGASLATSSFANQSSSSTASGFLQAFGASTQGSSSSGGSGGGL